MSEEVEKAPLQEELQQNSVEENQNEAGQETSNQQEEEKIIIYRCPQCRISLFKSTDIIPHEATKLRDFANKRRQFADGSNPCSSFFVEKPKWLDARGRMSDTIYCPKCNYKIGHFSWKGSQCSCGEWIKPSFQFPISRVDAI